MDTIVISARTHPGEVWSSFLMEEFINNILVYHKTSPSKTRYLLIPMLNPDGVIYGNFRCDFSGVDLNRAWSTPHKYTEPVIYQLKKILAKELEVKKAKYYIDLHSHSKNYNIFAYACA
jgi:murein tripeptide amidase MpaA